MTTAQASEYLSVSRRKLESWIRTGFLTVVRLDGTVRRIDIRVLDALIEANSRNGEDRR